MIGWIHHALTNMTTSDVIQNIILWICVGKIIKLERLKGRNKTNNDEG